MTRKLIWSLLAAIAAAEVSHSAVLATQASPPPIFEGKTLASGTFEEIDIHNHTIPAFWQSLLKTKGLSDLYVQSNKWQPGGTSGWHTHPGSSLIIVTGGTITAYEGDDPTCSPHVFVQGATFVDLGGGHAHVLRNEGSVDASTIAVQLIPALATRRIDANRPLACPSGLN